jgi:hypothetical protein
MPTNTVSAATYFPISTSPSRTGYVRSSSMVPLFFSSAKRRMVRSGSRKSRITLTFWKSGRSTPSVTERSRPIMGFIAACMLIRV